MNLLPAILIVLVLSTLTIRAMPRFFAAMPKPEPGRWVAVVISTCSFREDREVWTRECNGLLRAYLWARLIALREDLLTSCCDGELGIKWAVRKPRSSACAQ